MAKIHVQYTVDKLVELPEEYNAILNNKTDADFLAWLHAVLPEALTIDGVYSEDWRNIIYESELNALRY